VEITGAGYDLVGSYPALGRPRAGYRDCVKTCDFCGRTEEDEAKTLTWSTAMENGRARTFCEVCSRENLRAMEGKLDSEWW